jgi:hypothetical protein
VEIDSGSSSNSSNSKNNKSSSILTSQSSLLAEEAESDLIDSSLNSEIEIAPKHKKLRK